MAAVSLPHQTDHHGIQVITADGTETVHIKDDPGVVPSPPTDHRADDDEELQVSVQEEEEEDEDDQC